MPWVNCKVTRAGPAEDGTIFIALRSTSGSFNNWFVAVPQMEREMLAVALAAMSGDKEVTAALTATTEYATINRLYINA